MQRRSAAKPPTRLYPMWRKSQPPIERSSARGRLAMGKAGSEEPVGLPRRTMGRPGWSVAALRLALLTLGGSRARAATFTVRNLNSSGPGSLRQAVLDANAAAGPDDLGFDVSLAGAVLLAPNGP